MSTLIIIVAAFIGVATLVGGVAILLRGDSDSAVEDRLAMLTGAGRSGAKEARPDLLLNSFGEGRSLIEGLMSRVGNLKQFFEQADSPISPGRVVAIAAGLGGLGIVGSLFAGLPYFLVPLVALCGAVIPFVWLFLRRRRRLREFARMLPEALELISRALRAGHSLAAGFNLVATEMSGPIAKEFGRCYEEQNFGIPLDEALDEMTKRVPNLDLRFFATAVILQRQTGGDLAEILDKIGNLVRERFKIWGQIQALTGEGRLSGIVLLALPPVLFVAMYRINPDYCMPLFTDPLGHKMLAVALVMQLLGALVIRKIVNIKV